MCTKQILFINIRLCTIQQLGDPFVSVVNHIAAYFPKKEQPIIHDIPLDINPDSAESLEAHQAKLSSIVQEAKQYVHSIGSYYWR
jgi:hypothetical protein